VREVGEPLFRIRRRLAARDYGSLQPFADRLAAVAETHEPRGSTLYMARAAQLQYELQQSRREWAVVPLMDLYRLRAGRPELSAADEAAGLRFDEEGICENLLPVWFDYDAAQQAFKALDNEADAGPAAEAYRITLAIAARNSEAAEGRRASPWEPLYFAQSALLAEKPAEAADRLDPSTHADSAARHAIALYYYGIARRDLATASGAKADRAWMLSLLEVPANYEDRFPELAAAAIYAVVTGDEDRESESIRRLQEQLTGRYRDTVFGQRFSR
jgi:hypothetical protein